MRTRPCLHPLPVLPGLLAVLLLLVPVAAPPARAAEPDLEEAGRRLEHLDALLGSSRSLNEDLIAALDAVEASYLALPRGASPETEKAVARWRDRAERLALKAFVLVKRDRRERDRNVRDPVSVRAARLVGRTGNAALWKDLKRLLETRLFRARHHVPAPVLESAFDAIAALGDPAALAWMTDEFVHTNSSPEKLVERLVAAQQAFVKFPLERIPGAQRHAIVKKLVQLYPATETVAAESSGSATAQSTRRFWDRIRLGVIRAAQHFAGTPRNAEGEALATMQEFAAWFRAHKDVRRPPWSGADRPQG